MPPDVRLTSGVVFDLASGDRVVCDGRASGDVTVSSHAHGDHAVTATGEPVVCSPLTAALAAARRGTAPFESTAAHEFVELFDAGHVAGSRAARITDPATGRRYLYTGDLSTRDRFYLDGFEPVDADVLVVETTYGTPAYRFPPPEALHREILDWLADTMDRVVLLFGYSLGRAQKLQRLAMRAGRSRTLVTDAVATVNAVVEDHLSVSFDVEPYERPAALAPGDAVVLPGRPRSSSVVDALDDRDDVVTAGFSGWAVDSSFQYRGGFDVTFPLSDHCDFDELVAVVEGVDPERVYTHHGHADEFADHLTREHGYETRALRRNQSTLAEF